MTATLEKYLTQKPIETTGGLFPAVAKFKGIEEVLVGTYLGKGSFPVPDGKGGTRMAEGHEYAFKAASDNLAFVRSKKDVPLTTIVEDEKVSASGASLDRAMKAEWVGKLVKIVAISSMANGKTVQPTIIFEASLLG